MIFYKQKELSYELYLELSYEDMQEIIKKEFDTYISTASDNERNFNELKGFRSWSITYGLSHNDETKKEFLKDYKMFRDRVNAFEEMNNILSCLLDNKDKNYLDDFGFDYDEKSFNNLIKEYCNLEKEIQKSKEEIKEEENDIYISLL